jgi:hypothetical protein
VQDGQQQQRPISEQAVAGLAMPVRHGYKIDLVDLRAGQPLLQGCVASGLGCMVAGWESCGQQRSAAQRSAVLCCYGRRLVRSSLAGPLSS